VRPKICVSISATTTREAVEAVRSVKGQDPDLIEIRLDYMRGRQGLEEIRSMTRLPLIATCRRADQGGLSKDREDRRLRLLVRAGLASFDLVDLELSSTNLEESIDAIRETGAKLLISWHDLRRTPPRNRLKEILHKQMNLRPDICKIVGTANTVGDNLRYLSFLEQESSSCRLLSFGMGPLGTISRVLCPLFGGEFTYASTGKRAETAPGQLTIFELAEIYNKLAQSGHGTAALDHKIATEEDD